MDFSLSEEQQILRENIIRFAHEVLNENNRARSGTAFLP
jgi:hypothetical protein